MWAGNHLRPVILIYISHFTLQGNNILHSNNFFFLEHTNNPWENIFLCFQNAIIIPNLMASVLRVVRFRDEICELAWRAYVRKAACKQKYRIPQGLAPPAFPTSSFSPRCRPHGPSCCRWARQPAPAALPCASSAFTVCVLPWRLPQMSSSK